MFGERESLVADGMGCVGCVRVVVVVVAVGEM